MPINNASAIAPLTKMTTKKYGLSPYNSDTISDGKAFLVRKNPRNQAPVKASTIETTITRLTDSSIEFVKIKNGVARIYGKGYIKMKTGLPNPDTRFGARRGGNCPWVSAK